METAWPQTGLLAMYVTSDTIKSCRHADLLQAEEQVTSKQRTQKGCMRFSFISISKNKAKISFYTLPQKYGKQLQLNVRFAEKSELRVT
ncbi:hypothetical protein [Oscillibacter sp.]|uniref:hypothetical protein n=1 Tax=Oscillibacter sp. TaxID=1945593 RepID=UPI003390CE18